MHEFYEVKDGEVWLKSFLTYEARPVKPIGESEERTLEILQQNFSRFEEKVKKVFEKIDATHNKGSFFVQLQNFKTQMGEISAIGDFAPLFIEIERYEKEIHALIEQNRKRNLEIKNALMEEVKIVSASTSWKKAGEELNSIRLRWKKTGAVDPEINQQMEEEFQSYVDAFYKARSAFFEGAENVVDQYRELITSSQKLINAADKEEKQASEVVKELKEIQKNWKNLPPIPKSKYKELQGELNAMHNAFFTQYKEVQEKRKQAKQNERVQESMELKRALIEEAKKLLDSLPKDYMEQIKALRAKWKKSGFVPNEISDEVWTEFNYWIEKVVESGRLEKMVQEKAKSDGLNEKEVIEEKLKHLKRLVRKEKESLEKMNSNIGAFRINHKSKEFGQVLDSKAKEQERKWQVKHDIIRELEAELS